MNETQSLLEVRNVTHRFAGLVANRDVSMSIGRGELVGLIGPNGAGKSTLFNLVAGRFPPTEGKILFDGRDVTGLPAAKRCALGIARTFQVPRSFDSMNVVENVIVGGFVRHQKSAASRRGALDVLEFVGLLARADAPARKLTPAERRRLELARALATKPQLVLLDETMTGLTPKEAQAGVELIQRVREQGTTIIMVEHVMEIVMPLVDRVVVLDLGQIIADGKPNDVVRDARVIAAYLGERRRVA